MKKVPDFRSGADTLNIAIHIESKKSIYPIPKYTSMERGQSFSSEGTSVSGESKEGAAHASPRKRNIIISIVLVIALITVVTVAVLMMNPAMLHDNLTKDKVLRSTDLASSGITNDGQWGQTMDATKYAEFLNLNAGSTVPAQATESTMSQMTFVNSTCDLGVWAGLTEYGNNDGAAGEFQQGKAIDSEKAQTSLTLNGVECVIITSKVPGNDSADLVQTLSFHKGNFAGAVFVMGTGLNHGDHSLVTAIAELQLSRI